MKTHDREFFFKYTSATAAHAILTTLSVRWSSPLLFNDPFDTQLDFNPGLDASRLPDLLLSRIEAMIYSDDPLPPALHPGLAVAIGAGRLVRNVMSRADFLARYRSTIMQGFTQAGSIIEASNAEWTASLRSMRVFCVSEIHHDLLMWSHYANYHRGAVLQLRCLPEKDTALCAAEPIRYKADMPAWGTTEEWAEHLLGGSSAFLHGIFRLMAFTKSEHWQYEYEWRCFLNNGDGSRDLPDLFDAYHLEPEEISAVYLGCRMSPDDRAAISRIVREQLPETHLFQARRSRTQFAVEFDLVG